MKPPHPPCDCAARWTGVDPARQPPVHCGAPRLPDAGFTLVELVISLALMGFVLGLIAVAVRVLTTGFDKGAAVVVEQEMLSRAVEVLRSDITGMQRTVRREERRQSYVFQGGNDVMRYVVNEPGYPSEPGPYAITLVARSSGSAGSLTRSRAPIGGALFDIDRLAYSDDVVLIEGPFRVEFSYQERRGQKPGWVNSWLDRNRTLVAVVAAYLIMRGIVFLAVRR